ncbi:MAG: AarF/ABC1/UbiB kinase family protein [Gammaproteobacteria bacterium]|nr:AarF/ABC1/UbiB kinase family protein [Gammaproteobacteria bacterium]
MAAERRVTTSRLGRLGQLGRLAGGIAGGMLAEGARQVVQGKRPSTGSLLLTPGNANRLAGRLSEMRGAAMKVGQLLSMDSGEVLPRELTDVLARLREDAHAMPLGQVNEVLKQAWGTDWQQHFAHFSFTPLAAASIGQVHDARLKDGSRVAVKLQYPGIRQSIDSDVDNVASLLRLSRLVPDELDVDPLLDEAKRQLHAEADYAEEAHALQRFRDRLTGNRRFVVPDVITSLSNRDVLTMSFLVGRPIETAVELPRELRNRIARDLTMLAFDEVFEWGLVQTDPNFANYLYDGNSDRIGLLDFGATREYPRQTVDALRALLGSCINGSDDDIAAAAVDVGYLAPADGDWYRATVVDLLRTATEPARVGGDYRFGSTELVQRMGDILVSLRLRGEVAGRLPPPGILFLHRKLSGLYLLLSRLQAVLPVRQMADAIVAPTQAAERQFGG